MWYIINEQCIYTEAALTGQKNTTGKINQSIFSLVFRERQEEENGIKYVMVKARLFKQFLSKKQATKSR
jgi:hypothetical protein